MNLAINLKLKAEAVAEAVAEVRGGEALFIVQLDIKTSVLRLQKDARSPHRKSGFRQRTKIFSTQSRWWVSLARV